MIFLRIIWPNFIGLVWCCHTKFQIGIATAIPLPAPLLLLMKLYWLEWLYHKGSAGALCTWLISCHMLIVRRRELIQLTDRWSCMRMSAALAVKCSLKVQSKQMLANGSMLLCQEIHTARLPKFDCKADETKNLSMMGKRRWFRPLMVFSLSTIAALYYMLTLCSWWWLSDPRLASAILI